MSSTRSKKHRGKRHRYNGEPALSLSPFYSFSSHWKYLSQQFLCLTSWGTCVGGVNDQYDNILEHEASGPWMDDSIQSASYHKKDVDYSYYNIQNKAATYSQKPHDDSTGHVQYTKQIAYNVPSTAKQQTTQSSSKQTESKETTQAQPQAKHDTIQVPPSKEEDDHKTNNQLTPNPTAMSDVKHVKGQSFDRKLGLFNKAVQSKRKSLLDEQDWKNKRQASKRTFHTIEDDGTKDLQGFTYSPAAHGIKPLPTRKMSTKDYSKHMKTKEKPEEVIFDDANANASATDKIKFFQRISTPIVEDD